MIALFALYDKTKIYKIRDIILIMQWSLIKRRGIKNCKITGPTKSFRGPPFSVDTFFAPLQYGYRVKTTPKCVVPPLKISMA